MRIYWILSFLCFGLVAHAQTGTITGYVKDQKTQRSVPGARITVEGTALGAVTDTNGFYTIKNIPTKSYNVKTTCLGYFEQTLFDVIVTTGNMVSLDFYLVEKNNELKQFTVKTELFSRQPETPISINSLSSQEVKSFPGANFDIVKVAQSLPGVSGSVGFRNDLIIRGGAPNESVYYLDGVEVPNINHFATQGSGGGPVGMLNVAFIDEVSLSTSAFNARYDNPLSGVLQFRQKKGNKERTQGNFRLGASEAAFTLEGPIGKDKRWSYIASVRRSYLQFLFKLIDLPFLPNYWDWQYKVTFAPNSKNEISLIGLNAIDDFTFNPPKIDIAKDDPISVQENLFILNAVPKYTQYSATGGLSWKHLVKNGYTQLVISSNVLRNGATKYTDNDEADPSKLRLYLKSYEIEQKIRYEENRYKGAWKFNYGANLTWSRFKNNLFSQFYNPLIQSIDTITNATKLQFLKGGVFGQVSRSFFGGRLTLNAGLRTDVNSFTQNGLNPLRTLSPRLSGSYALTSAFRINASVGQYYKLAPYTVLGYQDKNGDFTNKKNPYISCRHYVAGVEYGFSRSCRITVEGFYKQYQDYPVSVRNGISLANLGGNFGFIGNEPIDGSGKGRAYGIEFCIQQKLTKNVYGILSYTFYYSQFTGKTMNYVASAWDNRHLVTFTGGYKWGKSWELGVRFRYLGGAPYTPYDTAASIVSYYYRGEGQLNYAKINSQRFSAFFGIDARIDKKWNFKKTTLDVFLDMQNVTSASNPTQPNFTYQRDPANPANFINNQGQSVPQSAITPQTANWLILPSNAGSLVPSIGVVVEF